VKILVWGNPYHVRLFEELFESDRDICIVSREEEADIFYRIWGWSLTRDRPEINRTFVQVLRGKKVVFHWIGTDVLRAMRTAHRQERLINPKSLIKRMASSFVRRNFTHWAVASWLQEELSTIGISSSVVPIVSPLVNAKPLPMPEQFTVLSYLPDFRPTFFGADIVYQLAELNPDVKFVIVAAQKIWKNLPNVEVRGCVDQQTMRSIYRESSCLVRLAEHDGLALTVLESLARGRYVIWSYDFPHVFKAKSLAQAQRALLQVKHKTRPNFEGAEYVRTEFSLEEVKQMTKSGFLRLMSGNTP
jgi:glycosyltransferase involved in cell wall biosynthesis